MGNIDKQQVQLDLLVKIKDDSQPTIYTVSLAIVTILNLIVLYILMGQ
jgi:hypothetical protein